MNDFDKDNDLQSESREIVSRFFTLLEKCGVESCVVGRSVELIGQPDGDIDFVVPKDKLRDISGFLYTFCQQLKMQMVQVRQHEPMAWYFHEGGKKALYDYLKRVTLLGGGATAAVAAIAAIAPDFWLGLVFGDQYIGHGYLLQWWAVTYVVVFLSCPLVSGLRAVKDTRSIFRAYLWATLFSVVAAYPMVEHFGLDGVMLDIFLGSEPNLTY